MEEACKFGIHQGLKYQMKEGRIGVRDGFGGDEVEDLTILE